MFAKMIVMLIAQISICCIREEMSSFEVITHTLSRHTHQNITAINR